MKFILYGLLHKIKKVTKVIGDLLLFEDATKIEDYLLRFSNILKEGSGVPCEDCGIIYQNFFYLRIHKRQAHEEISCKGQDHHMFSRFLNLHFFKRNLIFHFLGDYKVSFSEYNKQLHRHL